MTGDILEKDSDLKFPHLIVLKASAGSGKTHALSKRFVQFILSDRIPKNRLRNILAVTFSNNAAKEMRERILEWLKYVYFEDPKHAPHIFAVLSADKEKVISKAAGLIDEILETYSDFQVKTIDSFMTTIFKASAIDFGYNPEFDVVMNSGPLIKYSFDLFLRNVREGSDEAGLLEEIVSDITKGKSSDSSFMWEPSSALLDEAKKLYKKIASIGMKPEAGDFSKRMNELKAGIRETLGEIEDAIVKSGLDRSARSAFGFVLEAAQQDMFTDIIGRGIKSLPVNKPKKKSPALEKKYEEIQELWIRVGLLIDEYTGLYARSVCIPYIRLYEKFSGVIENVKRYQAKVFIEDINRNLAEYLNGLIVPDVYFRIGDTVFHYLVDEFQDTSPIQWRNLSPLIENSLAQNGSLFVVGDTKQAIYGFRNADYRIMRELETRNVFPSAHYAVHELETNFRSAQNILSFNERVFKGIIAGDEKYSDAGRGSGLIDYTQKVREGLEDAGYAEVFLAEGDAEEEKQRLQDLIGELYARGYKYRDIAVLTQRNEDVVNVASWLNEKNIPFISLSSLDIRRRKIICEVVALLNFLDSPTDDFSFASFLLGDVFANAVAQDNSGIGIEDMREFLFDNRKKPPLYKAFQERFAQVWETYFEELFKSAGYLPLYDLVTEAFSVFRLFENMRCEEAALVKLLEIAKDFEGTGYNSVRDFLEFAEDEGSESEWNMNVPVNMDSVKVMTIHKSKGLGFPVVIALLYGETNKGFDYIIEERGDSIGLLKVNRNMLNSGPSLEGLYEAERTKELVNKLNALYVGFTRPKEELYVIGVKTGKEVFPVNILPADEYPQSAKPEKARPETRETTESMPVSHYQGRIKFKAAPEGSINLEERQRGEFIHKVLSFIQHDLDNNDILRIIHLVQAEGGTDYDPGETLGLITRVIRNRDLAEFFEQRDGRTIKTEQEFSDREGNLFRMDRVVIDGDMAVVIDFKTGIESGAQESHVRQIKTYMKILRDIYHDRRVEGIIAYPDMNHVRRIN